MLSLDPFEKEIDDLLHARRQVPSIEFAERGPFAGEITGNAQVEGSRTLREVFEEVLFLLRGEGPHVLS